MRWYKHYPAQFLEGVTGLDAEERGFYITVIDLLYARDGKGVTDELVCSAIGCRPQVWRRVKANLLSKGKITETSGWLMANRVETTLQTAQFAMSLTRGFRLAQLKKQGVRPRAERAENIEYRKSSYNGEVQQEAGEGNVISWEEAEQWNKRR